MPDSSLITGLSSPITMIFLNESSTFSKEACSCFIFSSDSIRYTVCRLYVVTIMYPLSSDRSKFILNQFFLCAVEPFEKIEVFVNLVLPCLLIANFSSTYFNLCFKYYLKRFLPSSGKEILPKIFSSGNFTSLGGSFSTHRLISGRSFQLSLICSIN